MMFYEGRLKMIKEIYKTLNDQQKRELMYAFNNHITAIIEYQKGHFIGVNVVLPDFKILERENGWTVGVK